MSDRTWARWVEHPYATNKKTEATHGHLQPTQIQVPPYSSFAVPFLWMLRESQERISEALPYALPPDEESPFESPWVFSARRQEAIGNEFFGRLTPGASLVFFYTKSAQPVGENISRLVVGVGTVDHVSSVLRYEHKGRVAYPLWDRLFSHSIRPDGARGFLLPYHDYLEPTGSEKEDERRRELLSEVAVVPGVDQVSAFSFAGEHVSPDIGLSVLLNSLEAVRAVRRHGIASGPWDAREEWLNGQIAAIWEQRGGFPGTGAALEALGFPLGTALVFELLAAGQLDPKEDPWPLLEALFEGTHEPPRREYRARLAAVRPTWKGLSAERRALLSLLSRFAISGAQMRRWFEPRERDKATARHVSDRELLLNPYLIAETDLGDRSDHPVEIGMLDRGLLPDSTTVVVAPLPLPSLIEVATDPRRVRAGLVAVLRRRAQGGDSLVSEREALAGLEELGLARPCSVGSDWLEGNEEALEGSIFRVKIENGGLVEPIPCLQLEELRKVELRLGSILEKRAVSEVPSTGDDWIGALRSSISEGGGTLVAGDRRQEEALLEQARALEIVTSRKLSVLVGRAGTGKTTVLGALLHSMRLAAEGVLFLAPTGKATVRLAAKANTEALTVAQFLHRLGRYDGERQRPLFDGKDKYRGKKNVVIDECSMLTLELLHAVMQALDLADVKRIILVGDPNQLPPIGTGRPFADLVGHLEVSGEPGVRSALAKLTVEVRTRTGEPSDALRLASWFTRESSPVDSDRVLSDLEIGAEFRDLTLRYWKTPEELFQRLQEEFGARLGLKASDDIEGFNRALGLTPEGWVPFEDHNGAERFQVLSPTRLHAFGTHEINRWVQSRFRARQLRTARENWGVSLGEDRVVWGDKVILLQNGTRKGWGKAEGKVEAYLANGEIGVAASPPRTAGGSFLNVAFVGRQGVRFAFSPASFGQMGAPLELAYALTVHKAQGSEFETVFLVLPSRSRLLSRELIYTALTRARGHLVILAQGADPSILLGLSSPERSETARRNSNLFCPSVRLQKEEIPYSEHLIHRTSRGHFVRSKSELVISNYLDSIKLDYQYERPLVGENQGGKLRPDFSFVSDAGNLILWEHLGLLNQAEYRRGWEWKQAWYRENGFELGRNLFATTEEEGLDTSSIEATAQQVRRALEA